MKDLKTLNIEIWNLKDLKFLVEAYETIASMSMRRIRDSVLSNRSFHAGLDQIYQQVKHAYQKEMSKSKLAAHDLKNLSWIQRNGKTAFVFLSANTGLYGDIVKKTFQAFLEAARSPQWAARPEEVADLVVIGRLGKVFFDDSRPGVTYTYFDFPDNRIDLEILKKIIGHLHPYEKVVMFHGQFKNLLAQFPKISNIAGEEVGGVVPQAAAEPHIFEPSLEIIAQFFETEIFASLLEQIFHESRLAKLASRMVLLDRANLKIDNASSKLLFEGQRMKHRFYNRKQLDALSGISLWDYSTVSDQHV